jgi:hypothetical protein
MTTSRRIYSLHVPGYTCSRRIRLSNRGTGVRPWISTHGQSMNAKSARSVYAVGRYAARYVYSVLCVVNGTKWQLPTSNGTSLPLAFSPSRNSRMLVTDKLQASHLCGNDPCRNLKHIVYESSPENNSCKPCHVSGVRVCSRYFTSLRRNPDELMYQHVVRMESTRDVFACLVANCSSEAKGSYPRDYITFSPSFMCTTDVFISLSLYKFCLHYVLSRLPACLALKSLH